MPSGGRGLCQPPPFYRVSDALWPASLLRPNRHQYVLHELLGAKALCEVSPSLFLDILIVFTFHSHVGEAIYARAIADSGWTILRRRNIAS